jgi:hypothetical protein
MRILVAAETCSVVEAAAEQGNMPPLHVHYHEDEVFYVLRGRLTLHLPGTTVEVGPARRRSARPASRTPTASSPRRARPGS